MDKKITCVFFGTPEFAVGTLDALHKNSYYKIKLVVTNPDKPARRKLALVPSAVKQYAIDNHLPLLQPENINDPAVSQAIRRINPRVAVIVAFQKLPQSIWKIPTWGTLNIHPSLLPHYRGAAPLNWAIINGEAETGVSIIRINNNIDAGDILAQEKIPISHQMNVGELHNITQKAGAELLLKTLEQLEKNTTLPISQETYHTSSILKKAPKIFKEDCKLNFHKKAEELVNFVRGLSPYPVAYTYFADLRVKIFKVHVGQKEEGLRSSSIGEVYTDGKGFLAIQCQAGWLYVDELQATGKKRMSIKDFLKGWKPPSTMLTTRA